MSDENIIIVVQSLIDSKKGDPLRLQQILEKLQGGKPLDISDQDYIRSITSETSLIMPSEPQESAEPHEQDKIGSPFSSVEEEKNDETLEKEVISETRNSPSRKKIAIIASVIVAIVFVYVGLDAYSVSTLQFRPHSGNQYQISPTQIHIQADVCNPSFFPATFNKYEISAFYNSDLIERAELDGRTVLPKSSSTLDGVFVLNTDVVLRLKQENVTFDPALAKITTTVDAPIFGTIPFSIVKQYTAEQFQGVLGNGPPGSFSC